MTFPTHDWQFWAVTVFAVACAAWLLRGLAPWSASRRRRRRRERRATLTVEGKPIRR